MKVMNTAMPLSLGIQQTLPHLIYCWKILFTSCQTVIVDWLWKWILCKALGCLIMVQSVGSTLKMMNTHRAYSTPGFFHLVGSMATVISGGSQSRTWRTTANHLNHNKLILSWGVQLTVQHYQVAWHEPYLGTTTVMLLQSTWCLVQKKMTVP